jgi:hypothetical protein
MSGRPAPQTMDQPSFTPAERAQRDLEVAQREAREAVQRAQQAAAAAAGGGRDPRTPDSQLKARGDQEASIRKEIARAQAQLNAAESDGDKIIQQVARQWPLASKALQDHLVQLREAIKQKNALDAEDKKYSTTLAKVNADIRDLNATLAGHRTNLERLREEYKHKSEEELRALDNAQQWKKHLIEVGRETDAFKTKLGGTKGEVADLKNQLGLLVQGQDAHKQSLERLRGAHKNVSDALLTEDAQYEDQKKTLTEQVEVWTRFNQKLAEAKGAANQETDALGKLRAEFKGMIPDVKLAELATAEQADDARKKRAQDLKEFQDWVKGMREQTAAIGAGEEGSFARQMARFGGAVPAGERGQAEAAFKQLEDATAADRLTSRMKELRGELQASANPYSVYNVAVRELKKNFDELGPAAQGAVRQIADLMRRVAQSDLLRQATAETQKLAAAMRSLITGDPLHALRAQHPGIDEATLRALAGQQAQQRGISAATGFIQQAQAPAIQGFEQGLARFAGIGNMPDDRAMQALQRRMQMFAGAPMPRTPEEQAARLQTFQQMFSPREMQLITQRVGDPRAFFGQAGLAAMGQGKDQTAAALDPFEKAKAALFGGGGEKGGGGFFPQATTAMQALGQSSQQLLAAFGGGGKDAAAGGLTTSVGALTSAAVAAKKPIDDLIASLQVLAASAVAAAQAAASGGGGAGGASAAQIYQDMQRRGQFANTR